jgi:hypothetical protein
MKFSTTFTLATLALLSIGTHARIGEGQQVEGIRCCKVNDTDHCQVDWRGNCSQIGDTGLSCYHDDSNLGHDPPCCTSVDRGTWWFIGGCK